MTGAAQPSYSHGTAAQPLLGETIGENLSRIAAAHGDREAVMDVPSGHRWTYAELDAATDALARNLIAAGLDAGDRVGIWAPNCPEWVLLQYATAKAGVILVNINPAYRSHELGYALLQSGVRLLVSAESFRSSDYRAMIEEGTRRPPGPGAGDLPGLGRMGQAGAAGGAAPGGAADPLAARQATLSFDDPINIQYTSGTTGFPKGATLSHHNILNNGFFIGEGCRYTEQDRVCIPVPFYHCFGMVLGNLACTTHGAAIIIPAPGFDRGRHAALGGHRTVHLALRGADHVHRGAGAARFRRIRPVLAAHRHHGRLPLPGRGDEAGGERDAHDRGDDLLRDDRDVPRVGADPGRRRHGAAGVHRGPGAPARRGEDRGPGDGLVVPRDATGEMCTRGYSVMLGYWDDPEQTRDVIDTARWMHTGDLAVMDEAAYLNIVGRIKDMIIRGGENVYPREIEEFLSPTRRSRTSR